MEQMGGGGHLSNAATQIKDASISEVRQHLLDLIEGKQENKSDDNDDSDDE